MSPFHVRFLPRLCLALALTFAGLVGCADKAPPPPKPDQALEDFRRELNTASQHGEIGSGLDPVRERFEALKAEKPEIAAKIEKPFQTFLLSTSAEKRKEIAGTIEKELPPAGSAP